MLVTRLQGREYRFAFLKRSTINFRRRHPGYHKDGIYFGTISNLNHFRPGGLAKWGVVQNLVALFSSMLGLSIHSELHRLARERPIALERGIFLLLLTTVFIVFTHQILLWLDFEVLPKYGLSGYVNCNGYF